MAKILSFGTLDHSKLPYCNFWMILHDLVTLPNVWKHLLPSQYAISSRSNGPNPRKWLKNPSLVRWIIHKCLNDPSWPGNVAKHWKTFNTITTMQYQVYPTDLSLENGQKTVFWHFGSFKNAFLRSLNDPSWPGNVAESWKTYSTITICNIKSTQQTKLMKMAKNLFFGALDHSKMHLFWFLNDPAWPVNVAKWSKTFSTTTICNIKLIRSTNLKKMV